MTVDLSPTKTPSRSISFPCNHRIKKDSVSKSRIEERSFIICWILVLNETIEFRILRTFLTKHRVLVDRRLSGKIPEVVWVGTATRSRTLKRVSIRSLSNLGLSPPKATPIYIVTCATSCRSTQSSSSILPIWTCRMDSPSGLLERVIGTLSCVPWT